MESLSPSFNRLVSLIARLPGIGAKTAQRLAYFILKNPRQYAKQLSDEISGIHDKIGFCSKCGLMTESDPCAVCLSARRDKEQICVVENPADALKIEDTREYRGLYHVLMGSISPLNKVFAEDLKIKELLHRVDQDNIKEVILATSPTVEGDTTALYIAKLLETKDLIITRIAKGLPIGGDLEYADSETLARSIEGRLKI
ncbi:MAG: recombination protein RecR [Spirochaetes bacterium]|nr:recombination protein RecR [Spirochaetota bacterium]